MKFFSQIFLWACMLIAAQAAAQPVANFTANQVTGCVPHVVTFTSTSTGNPTSYLWDFGNNNTSVLQNPSVSYTTAGVYTVKLTVTGPGGSNTKTMTNYITVNPAPTVTFSSLDTVGCPPLSVQFTNTSNPQSSGNVIYSWSFGDGSSFSPIQSPSHLYTTPGYFPVTLNITNSFGCNAFLTKQNYIHVLTPPAADFTATPNNYCKVPAAISFSSFVTGTGPYTYSWTFGDGGGGSGASPGHTYNSPGSYTVRLIVTDAKGCKDTLEKINYINIGTTQAGFTYQNACPLDSTKFTNTSTPSDSVRWRFGDGGTDTARNPRHIYAASGTYNVTLIIYNNPCVDSIILPVTVYPTPVAAFSVLPAIPCPSPVTLQYTNNSTGASTYKWDFGDASPIQTQANPSHTFMRDSSYIVKLVAISQNGCKDSLSIKDSVDNLMITMFVDSDITRNNCVPFTDTFSLRVWSYNPAWPIDEYPYPGGVTSYYWTFGNFFTSTSPNPAVTFTTPGTYFCTYTINTGNGCSRTDTFIIEAGTHLSPSFIGYPDTLCVNDSIHLVNTTAGVTPNTTFTWMPRDNYNYISPTNDLVYQYDRSGIFDVSLISNNQGCIDTFTVQDAVVVNPPTSVLRFTYDCDTPTLVHFTDTASSSPTSVLWIFGDGTYSTLDNPNHVYPALGTYTVTLVTYNSTYGCIDSSFEDILLYNTDLTFLTADTAICRYDSITFFPTYPQRGGFYTWWINDTVPYWPYQMTMPPPNFTQGKWGHKFYFPGIYKVTVASSDGHGCPDTAYRDHYILVADPVASFTASPLVGCTPLTVNFTENSTNTPGAYSVSRYWDFGNNTTSTVTTANTSAVYNNSGLYSVSMIVTDNVGCSDTIKKTNYIQAQHPHAHLSASNTTPCKGVPIQFFNSSTGIGMTYYWDFGDNTYSTAFSPMKAYAANGSYTVKLIVTDNLGCKDTAVQTNYINISSPTASFTMSDSISICPPLNVQFTNTSTGASYYLWNFGNSSTSVVQNPTATYTNPGIYTIQLVAYNSAGCSDTTYYSNMNVLGYAGALTYAPLTGCSPLTVKFHSNLNNIPSIVWDFSDGVTVPATSDSIIHIYTEPGAYIPKLIMSDNTGCQNASVGIDTVKVDGVLAGFVTSPACINTPVTFTDTSFSFFSAVTGWLWSFNNGQQTSNINNPVRTYAAPGSYPVTLIATNAQGCVDTVNANVTIYSLPVINAGLDTSICNGDAAHLAASGGISYVWTPAATLSCSNCPSPVASPTTPTSYVVTGTDQHGCKNNDTVKVNIQLTTTSKVDKGGEICQDSSFRLRAFDAQRYEWTPAESLDDPNIASPLASPQATTTYIVTAWEGSCPPDTHMVKVVVHPKPGVDAGSDQTIVAGTSALLNATATNATSFLWSPVATLSCDICSNPTARPKVTTQYKVVVTSDYGCRNSDSVTIHLLCDNSQLFIPNTFSPNADGENDVFYPRGEGMQQVNYFRVYNRWGELMYERTNIQLNDAAAGWDGTYKGRQLNPDVYVYVLDGICFSGETLHWKGDITLIR